MNSDTVSPFGQLNLKEALLEALDDVGYETPSPIQASTIPLLLEGRDLLGQAQTGTGKTAAFALPLLSNLDLAAAGPQVLVLAPTRELALQVAEAFQKYASHMKGFHVLPVYGGQDYRAQIRALERGVHVVVGTPGRVTDHMRRGTLKLDHLRTLVLDEADEMLRMGFIDEVEWILEQTPPQRQTALFSATLPARIRGIAAKHLREPAEVTIKVNTGSAETIRQRYWPVSGLHKLDALTRILEAEPFDATLIFVRTKIATAELSEKLEARGYASAPLNGDIPQNLRERTVAQLKNGQLDIIVATDVAARGLDVERISHVINYDIPYDTEAYIHRIGRTGRAGRQGDAILFVAPREKRLLYAIEKATKRKIELMELPSTELINDKRIARFKQRITDTLGTDDLELFHELIAQYEQEHNVPAQEIAAALAYLLQGETPLLITHREDARSPAPRSPAPAAESRERRPARGPGKDSEKRPHKGADKPGERQRPLREGLVRYRVEVGHQHKVKPANIVGAIANEAGMEGRYIGNIDIRDDHSLVDLPEGMPKEIFNDLKKVWVAGQRLNISRVTEDGSPIKTAERPASRPKRPAKVEKPARKPKKKLTLARKKPSK
ncbi:MAG: DEAD/DEAH box helicase [Gammaproteobacteria bacterium]|nr:DEAD/DEAH box helicase [Gammaproteobacteria bacterium]